MNTNRVKCPLCGSWVRASRISRAISEIASQPRPRAKGTSEVRACWSREPEAENLFPVFCRALHERVDRLSINETNSSLCSLL